LSQIITISAKRLGVERNPYAIGNLAVTATSGRDPCGGRYLRACRVSRQLPSGQRANDIDVTSMSFQQHRCDSDVVMEDGI
jgi:hypothetical protein